MAGAQRGGGVGLQRLVDGGGGAAAAAVSGRGEEEDVAQQGEGAWAPEGDVVEVRDGALLLVQPASAGGLRFGRRAPGSGGVLQVEDAGEGLYGGRAEVAKGRGVVLPVGHDFLGVGEGLPS